MSKDAPSTTVRAFTWISVLVLIAGVIAFATVKIGGGGDESGAEAAPASEALPDGAEFTPEAPKPLPVPSAARKAAGEFILAAAGREDLDKAWALAHPTMKRDCGCTKKEWLTGNIPVVYYPTDNLKGASFAVDESTKRRVVMQVALVPSKGADVEPQAFYIGLKAVGDGPQQRWLVDYWAPISATPLPQVG